MRVKRPQRMAGSVPRTIARMSVDLPAPFSPTTATFSPRRTSKDAEESSCFSPARRDRFSTDSVRSSLFSAVVKANTGGCGGGVGFCSRSILSSFLTRDCALRAVVARTMLRAT